MVIITSGLFNEQFPVGKKETVHEYKIDGIRVVSVSGGFNDGRRGTSMSGWRRLQAFHKFARMVTHIGPGLDPPDIVFATHTPLQVGLAGARLGRIFAVPFVFEVRDLWPEALVNVGVLRNSIVIWWLKRMARRIYHDADHIVALSPGMKEGIGDTMCRRPRLL